MPFHIGTSGWNFPAGRGTWNGVFYPARRPRGFDELAYYAERFGTVEINSTFYRVPDPSTTEGWLRRTPPSFLFSAKLYQKFTHPDMYLRRPGVRDWDVSAADLDAFRRGLDPLARADRLGALLVQFPSSFHAGEDTADYLDWLLESLAGYPLAVELRHRSWSDDAAATRARIEGRAAAWAHIDEPKFASSIDHPIDGASPAVPLVYVRLHGRNAGQWWTHEDADDRYDYLYSSAELAPVAEAVRRQSATGRRVLVYFNNHFSAKAVANAAILRHQLGEAPPGDYPAGIVARYPELAGVVATGGLPLGS